MKQWEKIVRKLWKKVKNLLDRWDFKINNKTNKKAESKLLKKFNNLGSFLCEKWKKLFSNLAIFKSLEYNNTIKQRGDENVTIY